MEPLLRLAGLQTGAKYMLADVTGRWMFGMFGNLDGLVQVTRQDF